MELNGLKIATAWIEHEGVKLLITHSIPEDVKSDSPTAWRRLVLDWEGLTANGEKAKMTDDEINFFLRTREGIDLWSFIVAKAVNVETFFDVSGAIKNFARRRNGE
jgi:hypothetical protein